MQHRNNLQLVHSECHKTKTNVERALYAQIREVRKELGNTKTTTQTADMTMQTLIELYKRGKTKALNLDPEGEKRLKQLYNIAVRL